MVAALLGGLSIGGSTVIQHTTPSEIAFIDTLFEQNHVLFCIHHFMLDY